jgi:3-hydroxybutyryl-CoA dehydrogenase
MVVEEGVARPEDVDGMWKIFTSPGIPPFRLMDRVGLDVVLDIEQRISAPRPSGEPRKLLHEMIEEGRLGVKSRPWLLRLFQLNQFRGDPHPERAVSA